MVTTAASGTHRHSSARAHTVEIAGVDWPVYKLQSVLAFAVVLITVAVAAHALVPAVWLASLTSVTVWWIQRIRHRRG